MLRDTRNTEGKHGLITTTCVDLLEFSDENQGIYFVGHMALWPK